MINEPQFELPPPWFLRKLRRIERGFSEVRRKARLWVGPEASVRASHGHIRGQSPCWYQDRSFD